LLVGPICPEFEESEPGVQACVQEDNAGRDYCLYPGEGKRDLKRKSTQGKGREGPAKRKASEARTLLRPAPREDEKR